MIVIPQQMEHSMDYVSNDFLLPGGPKMSRLFDCLRNANKDLAPEFGDDSAIGVWKGDYVSWPGMTQEGLI